MAAEEVVAVVDALDRAGVDVWLDGGWGVDALLERERRRHDDLDLVVALEDVPALRAVLARRGYSLEGGGPPMSFELVDGEGRQVDVHPVAFDAGGHGVYRMRDGGDWIYPASGFAGRGSVLGRPVRCLTPEVQALCHSGYDLTAKDHEDLRALRDRFGVEPPA